MTSVPIIDLFAGPGGLGEGFKAYRGPLGFDVSLSVEKDPYAHKTLELRSFFRQFPDGSAPDLYYRYIRGEGIAREELFEAFPAESERAKATSWRAELGSEPIDTVLGRIEEALVGTDHWVLIGGPPCQAYSTIGRSRMKGMDGFQDDHRHTLYREYLKIVAAFQPTVFVMENVKGILSSQHREQRVFTRILEDMKDPWAALDDEDRTRIPKPDEAHSYKIYSFSTPVAWEEQLGPLDYVIESERYGVPQKRHRVILFGIREDYPVVPPALEEAGAQVALREVIGGMPSVVSSLSVASRNDGKWAEAVALGFGDEFLEQVDDSGVRAKIRSTVSSLSAHQGQGGGFVPGGSACEKLGEWLNDARIGGVIQHEARSHMTSDLHRYLFCSCHAEVTGRFPRLDEFPRALWPAHANAVADQNGKVANFRDRFRVQVWNEPATTVTSHIRKDGHYFIHPDPAQCRSLTVREAARLQTFPDNYFFEGPRTQQFKQVGNAVPPFLAFQLADIVAEVLEECMDLDVDRSPGTNVRYVAG